MASRHYRTSLQRRAAGDAHVLQQLHYLWNPLRCDSEMRDWRAEGGGRSTWTLRAGKSKGSKSSVSLSCFFLSRCTSILKPKIKRTPACRCWHHPFFPLFLKDITAPGNNMFKTFENKLSTLPTAPSLATPLALDLQFRCSTPLN